MRISFDDGIAGWFRILDGRTGEDLGARYAIVEADETRGTFIALARDPDGSFRLNPEGTEVPREEYAADVRLEIRPGFRKQLGDLIAALPERFGQYRDALERAR